jgi:hypothetical protein
MERRGAAGGRATVKKHGKAHMAAIGAKSFAATVARHYAGDREEYLRAQRAKAAEYGVSGFVDRLLREELAEGKRIASRELPVFSDPDDDGLPW